VSLDPLYLYSDADERSILKYLQLRREGKRVSARDEQIPAEMGLANETDFPHKGHIDFVDNRVDPKHGDTAGAGVFSNADHRLEVQASSDASAFLAAGNIRHCSFPIARSVPTRRRSLFTWLTGEEGRVSPGEDRSNDRRTARGERGAESRENKSSQKVCCACGQAWWWTRSRWRQNELFPLLHSPSDFRSGAFHRHCADRWAFGVSIAIAQYPEIAPPTVVVRAVYPGANPKVLAETVATPIEQEVNGVENMLYMSSTSTSDGVMSLTITFKLGTDLNIAQVLVQNRVAIALPKLPEESAPPWRHKPRKNPPT
jgi:hypothetical protein